MLQQQSRNKDLVTVFHRIPENATNLSTFKEYHCAGQVRCSMVGTVILLDTVHIIRNLLRAFFYLGRLFPLGHQIGSFSLESSETGTQYASTLPFTRRNGLLNQVEFLGLASALGNCNVATSKTFLRKTSSKMVDTRMEMDKF